MIVCMEKIKKIYSFISLIPSNTNKTPSIITNQIIPPFRKDNADVPIPQRFMPQK